MIKFQFDENNSKGTIILEGSLTLENLKEIKNSFISALCKTDQLIIDHSNADVYDFSYLQLLMSLMKTSEQLNKKLIISSRRSEKFRALVRESGYSNMDILKTS